MEGVSESRGQKGKTERGNEERACFSPRVLRGRLRGLTCKIYIPLEIEVYNEIVNILNNFQNTRCQCRI